MRGERWRRMTGQSDTDTIDLLAHNCELTSCKLIGTLFSAAGQILWQDIF